MTSTAPIREDLKQLPFLGCTVNQGSPRAILAGVQIGTWFDREFDREQPGCHCPPERQQNDPAELEVRIRTLGAGIPVRDWPNLADARRYKPHRLATNPERMLLRRNVDE